MPGLIRRMRQVFANNHGARRSEQFRPAVEGLEERLVLSATPAQVPGLSSVLGGTLSLQGAPGGGGTIGITAGAVAKISGLPGGVSLDLVGSVTGGAVKHIQGELLAVQKLLASNLAVLKSTGTELLGLRNLVTDKLQGLAAAKGLSLNQVLSTLGGTGVQLGSLQTMVSAKLQILTGIKAEVQSLVTLLSGKVGTLTAVASGTTGSQAGAAVSAGLTKVGTDLASLGQLLTTQLAVLKGVGVKLGPLSQQLTANLSALVSGLSFTQLLGGLGGAGAGLSSLPNLLGPQLGLLQEVKGELLSLSQLLGGKLGGLAGLDASLGQLLGGSGGLLSSVSSLGGITGLLTDLQVGASVQGTISSALDLGFSLIVSIL